MIETIMGQKCHESLSQISANLSAKKQNNYEIRTLFLNMLPNSEKWGTDDIPTASFST